MFCEQGCICVETRGIDISIQTFHYIISFKCLNAMDLSCFIHVFQYIKELNFTP